MAKSRSTIAVAQADQSVEAVLEQVLQLGVRIPQPQAVAAYLQQHPKLLTVMVPIVQIARQRLPDATLSLELYIDPEIDDKYLTLYARFPTYEPSTMARIDAVCEEYEPLLEHAHSWLLLTTDYRLPD
ncbi:MAG: hypothetical protein ABDI19_07570 [Armatimonadota bacterium]